MKYLFIVLSLFVFTNVFAQYSSGEGSGYAMDGIENQEVGVPEPSPLIFTIYPNPAPIGSSINIFFQNKLFSGEVFMNNMKGENLSLVSRNGKLKIPAVSPGLYIIKGIASGNIWRVKLFVLE